MKRDKSIKIRVTPDELEELQVRKEGAELATWVRELALGQSKPRRTVASVSPDLLRSLASIGNNINQIARQCNTNMSAVDYVAVLVELSEIKEQLTRVKKEHDS